MNNAILSFRLKLAILALGLPIIGYLVYVLHKIVGSSFMELAHKLAV